MLLFCSLGDNRIFQRDQRRSQEEERQEGKKKLKPPLNFKKKKKIPEAPCDVKTQQCETFSSRPLEQENSRTATTVNVSAWSCKIAGGGKIYEGSPRVVGFSTLLANLERAAEMQSCHSEFEAGTSRRRFGWDLSSRESWIFLRLENSRMHFAAGTALSPGEGCGTLEDSKTTRSGHSPASALRNCRLLTSFGLCLDFLFYFPLVVSLRPKKKIWLPAFESGCW